MFLTKCKDNVIFSTFLVSFHNFFLSIVFLNTYLTTEDFFIFFLIIISKFFSSEIKTSVESPKEFLVDDPDEMFPLADLLEGVSVDCAELSSETCSTGMNNLIVTQDIMINNILFMLTTTLKTVLFVCF